MQEKEEVFEIFAVFLICGIAGALFGAAVAKLVQTYTEPREEDFVGG